MQQILVCRLLPYPNSTLIAGLLCFSFSIMPSQFVVATLCFSDALPLLIFSISICFLHRLHDQMIKLNQSLHRLQVAWREAQQISSPSADNLREQFERLMTIYLSTKAAMTEPQMLKNCLNLQVSMAVLLVQLAIGNQGTELMDLTFPLPEVKNSALAYVPGDQQEIYHLEVGLGSARMDHDTLPCPRHLTGSYSLLVLAHALLICNTILVLIEWTSKYIFQDRCS